jgi:signal transduction histidine kinase
MQLPAGVPLVAYRFAQEALTNVSKHAQATRVMIDLSMSRRRAVAGSQRQRPRPGPGDLAKARSFGIRGLHERASTVGGWVDLSSDAAAPR